MARQIVKHSNERLVVRVINVERGATGRSRRRELRRLAAMLPAPTSTTSSVDELHTILHAVKFIRSLERTVIARVNAGTLPFDVLGRLRLAANQRNAV